MGSIYGAFVFHFSLAAQIPNAGEPGSGLISKNPGKLITFCKAAGFAQFKSLPAAAAAVVAACRVTVRWLGPLKR